MSEDLDQALSGALSPPMENGEVVFEAPWQGRAFGMARTLAQAGAFSWDEFRAQLIRVIGKHDQSQQEKADYQYYDHFLEALEAVLAEKKLLDQQSLAQLVDQLEALPHGHDH